MLTRLSASAALFICLVNPLAAAEAINLEQSADGPAVLNPDGSYHVDFTILATNSGDTSGTYILAAKFEPTPQMEVRTVTLEYVQGDETQQGSPVLNGPTEFEVPFPIDCGEEICFVIMIEDEPLAAGASESWSMHVDFRLGGGLADPRGRGEGGDFLEAVEPVKDSPITRTQSVSTGTLQREETYACNDANPVAFTGLHSFVAGSATDTDLTDNSACTSLPESLLNISLTVDGPAVLNAYGNFNVSYTITISNAADGPGFYDLEVEFFEGEGIELAMAFLSCLNGCNPYSAANGPAMISDPAPLNSGGPWAGGIVSGQAIDSWQFTAAFDVDDDLVSADGSDCDTGNEDGLNTGFFARVTDQGGIFYTPLVEDLNDNDACTPLPLPVPPGPDISLVQSVSGPAIENPDGSYTVLYTVTATNEGNATGLYDLVDEFWTGNGITLADATLEYLSGDDTQTGVPILTGALNFSDSDIVEKEDILCDDDFNCGEYFTRTFYTLVTGESLAPGAQESWLVTATFDFDPEMDLEGTLTCSSAAPVSGTGFYNFISGNIRVVDERNIDYFLAEDRSDNGACTSGPLRHINAALNDAWVSDDAALQGMFVSVFPALNALFLSWFTFDTVPPGGNANAVFGAADQRWVTAFGTIEGTRAILDAEITEGGIFNASIPEATQRNDGTLTVDFLSCSAANVAYDFPSLGLQGVVPIHRVLDSNIPLCGIIDAALQAAQ